MKSLAIRWWWLTAAGTALALAACDDEPRFPGHGLRSFEIRMSEDYAGEMLGGASQHIEYPATVWVDGKSHPALVSAAGATSIQETKKSFNVEFQDGYAINGSSDVRLATTIKDRSMLRSLIGYEVFRATGLEVPRAEPVFVYLNSLVMGLYIETEKINEDFFVARGMRIDRMFSSDGEADFASDFGSRLAVCMKVEFGPDDLEPILEITRVQTIGDETEFEREIFRRIDRESLVRYLTGARLLNHWDGFNKNVYWYALADDPVLRFAPWDLDNILVLGWNADPEVWAKNHLFLRLGRLPSVAAEVDARVAALLAGDASAARLRARANEWAARIADAYAADPFLGGGRYDFDERLTDLGQEIDAWESRL